MCIAKIENNIARSNMHMSITIMEIFYNIIMLLTFSQMIHEIYRKLSNGTVRVSTANIRDLNSK